MKSCMVSTGIASETPPSLLLLPAPCSRPPGELQGTNLVAWRHDLQLASMVPADEADPANAAAMPPPTLIVLNPGDPDPASIEMQDRGAAVTKA
jgi:hypothetical protein